MAIEDRPALAISTLPSATSREQYPRPQTVVAGPARLIDRLTLDRLSATRPGEVFVELLKDSR